jgi:hypothetical protein
MFDRSDRRPQITIQRAPQFLHSRGLVLHPRGEVLNLEQLLARPKQVSDQGLKVEPVVPSAVPGLESVCCGGLWQQVATIPVDCIRLVGVRGLAA